MRVILTTTNRPADYETGYALRLIEQARAIPAPKQTAEDEAKAEAILSQRTEFKHEGITPPAREGVKLSTVSEEGTNDVSAEEWVKGEEGKAKQRRKPRKQGEGNVAG